MFTEKERNILFRLLDAAIKNTVSHRHIAPAVLDTQINEIFSISEKLGAPITRETDFIKTIALTMKNNGEQLGQAPKVCCKDCGLDFNEMAFYEEMFTDKGDVVCVECLSRRHEMDKSDVEYWKRVSKYSEYERERMPFV